MVADGPPIACAVWQAEQEKPASDVPRMFVEAAVAENNAQVVALRAQGLGTTHRSDIRIRKQVGEAVSGNARGAPLVGGFVLTVFSDLVARKERSLRITAAGVAASHPHSAFFDPNKFGAPCADPFYFLTLQEHSGSDPSGMRRALNFNKHFSALVNDQEKKA
jgi:hypothetical protein